MDIGQWLTQHGFGEYATTFITNAVDRDVLVKLTNEDLRALGVKKLGTRKRLLAAIALLAHTDERLGYVAASHRLVQLSLQLPSPIAIPLAEYAEEPHPLVKLWSACDTMEMLLRLLTIAGVARAVSDGPLPDSLLDQLTDVIERPTLNAWFVMTKSLSSKATLEISNFVEDPLRAVLYGLSKQSTPDTSFVSMRNRLAHGGGLVRSEAARLLAIWRGPFENVIESATFLTTWQLLGRDLTGSWCRLAGRNPTRLDEDSPTPDDDEADAVWLNTGKQLLRLWPLALHGRPRTQGQRSVNESTQVYTRREPTYLVYTPLGSAGVGQTESDPKAVKVFEELFRVAERRAIRTFQIADFLSDIRKDANDMVGRQEEVAYVLRALRESDEGVWWLSGSSGMGKSFLMARLAMELQARRGKSLLVYAYRFRVGDQARCSRQALAQYLVERLTSAGAIKEFHRDKPTDKAEKRLAKLFSALETEYHVTILLDGLDEIVRRDPDFAEEIPLGLGFPRVRWLCAGQPIARISDAMRRKNARELFADGLPPMRADDIRGMILEKIGPLRRALFKHDREIDGSVSSPFIELVAQRAAGFPLYVKYVIGDVLSGKLRGLDGAEQLPPSLTAYHEDLILRSGIGDLQTIRTPLMAILACALEPLPVAALSALLAYSTRFFADDGTVLVQRGLALIETMTRTTMTPDQEIGFTLAHQSLRDHILQSESMMHTVSAAKAVFADLASSGNLPTALKNYRLRCGVKHLLDARRDTEARCMLLELGTLADMHRLNVTWSDFYSWWTALGGEHAAADYVSVIRSAVGELTADVCRQLELLVTWVQKSGWYELAAQMEPVLLSRREGLIEHYDGVTVLLKLAECRYETGAVEELKAIILSCNLHAIEGFSEGSAAEWMLDFAYWNTGEQSKCSAIWRDLATTKWDESEWQAGEMWLVNEIHEALFGDRDEEKAKQLILRAITEASGVAAFKADLLQDLKESAALYRLDISDLCRWVIDNC